MSRRVLGPLAILAILITAASARDSETKLAGVDFDSKLSFACHENTPKAFTDHNKKIVEARIRISANFASMSPDVEYIQYELEMPNSVEIADWLPNTQLDSDILSAEEMTTATDVQTVIIGVDGKLNPQIRGASAGYAGGSWNNKDEKTRQSIVKLSRRPPKHAVVVAGTMNRGQTLYFKLRRSSDRTLEGSKEFVLLLVAPSKWEGDSILAHCTAIRRGDMQTVATRSLGIALYVEGNESAKASTEKEARLLDEILGKYTLLKQNPANSEPRKMLAKSCEEFLTEHPKQAFASRVKKLKEWYEHNAHSGKITVALSDVQNTNNFSAEHVRVKMAAPDGTWRFEQSRIVDPWSRGWQLSGECSMPWTTEVPIHLELHVDHAKTERKVTPWETQLLSAKPMWNSIRLGNVYLFFEIKPEGVEPLPDFP